jgi:hypothetical protein
MRMMHHLTVGTILALMPVAIHAADYDWATNEYNYASRQLTDFTNRFQDNLVDPVLRNVRRASAAQRPRLPRSPNRPSLPVTTSAKSLPASGPILFTPVAVAPAQSTARRIAAAYPAQAQAQAEWLFNQLLATYAKVERENGVPHGDLGAAVAFFLGGNWMALNNSPLSDAKFVPIIGQMRTSLAASPGLVALTNRQKQEIYEQMVINGMFMATTQMALSKKNNPAMVARMQDAARANLSQWLGTDAARLRVTANGLEVAAK